MQSEFELQTRVTHHHLYGEKRLGTTTTTPPPHTPSAETKSISVGCVMLGKTNPYTSVQGLAHHDPPSRLHLGSHRDDPRPVIYLVILSSGLPLVLAG
jgi:hypothetical protein